VQRASGIPCALCLGGLSIASLGRYLLRENVVAWPPSKIAEIVKLHAFTLSQSAIIIEYQARSDFR
jgi:hypothetical protein